jgi:penicillin amidase
MVAGLHAGIEILRDKHAVPYVIAGSRDDAAFGLGYSHAQDRLWQMETSRRFVQGRLSELFGTLTLSTDVTMRTLGLYPAAQQSVKHLSPEARRILESYAAGVNAFLANNRGRLPIEFALAGDTPEPWTPADSLAVLKGMAYRLSGNASGETARVNLLSRLGLAGVQSFFAPFDAVPLPDYLNTLFGTTQLSRVEGVRDITASNDWVVDGAHSVTGKPLLANDPHLGFEIPITWYLAHLATPDGDVSGGTLPGVPAVIVGHNRHVAWGITNTGPDTQDLYIEQLDPDNAQQYRTPDGWAPFVRRSETIKVRFGKDRAITVRQTRHGPVLPDGQLSPTAPKNSVIALAWTGLSGEDTTFDAVLGVNAANDAAQFRAAMTAFIAPMQNIVYADDAGETGLLLPGNVPVRASGNDSQGLVPAPGWEKRYDWTGFIARDALPSLGDPPEGFIATANNKTVPDSYPYQLSVEWEPPYRHDRIAALLAATPKHSLDSMQAIQLDSIDSYALTLKSYLNMAGPFTGREAKAAALLAAWNGAMLKDRPEPLIFAAWARALSKRIYADELGPAFPQFWDYRPEFTLRVLNNKDGAARWCDDKGTAQKEDCASRIRLALTDAVDELSKAYGDDPAQWRWGDAHQAAFGASPLGALPVIGSFFNREAATDGGPFTIRRADNTMASGHPYAATHGSGYRGLYDLADPDKSRFIIATGESGNVFSPYYDDMIGLWAKGGYITIPSARDQIEQAARYRLNLQPERSDTVPNRPR